MLEYTEYGSMPVTLKAMKNYTQKFKKSVKTF